MCVCVHDREGVSQEGKKNLHRYKERERDMYAMVENSGGCCKLQIEARVSRVDAPEGYTTRKRPTNGAPNLAINGALVVRH